MEVIHIKTYLVNTVVGFDVSKHPEIRRFDMEMTAPMEYEVLEEKIRIAYQGVITVKDKLKLFWFDDENEEIGFIDDSGFQYAVNFWKAIKPDNSLLKLNIRTEIVSKKSIRKTPKEPKPAKVNANAQIVSKEPELPPPICNGCDKKLLENQFKSYVCPQINLCNQCQKQNSEFIEQPKLPAPSEDTKAKRVPNSISVQQLGELGQKSIANLATFSKKMNSNISNLYQNNVKVLLPGYKLSELSKKTESAATTSKSNDQLNAIAEEEIKKQEKISEALSLPVSADELDDELDEPVLSKSFDMNELESFQIIESEEQSKGIDAEEIISEAEKSVDTENMVKEVLEKLKPMGIVEDDNNNLRHLIKLKNGDVDKIVNIYFESFNQEKEKKLEETVE